MTRNIGYNVSNLHSLICNVPSLLHIEISLTSLAVGTGASEWRSIDVTKFTATGTVCSPV